MYTGLDWVTGTTAHSLLNLLFLSQIISYGQSNRRSIHMLSYWGSAKSSGRVYISGKCKAEWGGVTKLMQRREPERKKKKEKKKKGSRLGVGCWLNYGRRPSCCPYVLLFSVKAVRMTDGADFIPASTTQQCLHSNLIKQWPQYLH